MTDVYQTLSELNIVFQCMILDMLGYAKTGSPPDYDPTAFKYVRVSWPTAGAPAWKLTENVTFIKVIEDDEAINRQREVEVTRIDSNTLNEKITYTRVISLAMIFYGPNSFESAQIVRDGVFKDTYRLPLVRSKLYTIPDIISPDRIPELFQGRWWERADLKLRFNEQIVKNREIKVIESAEIVIENEEGTVGGVTIVADE